MKFGKLIDNETIRQSDNDNQILKFGKLIECSLRKIFLEKLYSKCGGKIIPRPFFKKPKLSIFLDQYFKVLYILFLSLDQYSK